MATTGLSNENNNDENVVVVVDCVSQNQTRHHQQQLPFEIWKENVFPYLNRSSWNALIVADSNLYRRRKSLHLPPWPTKSGRIDCAAICVSSSSPAPPDASPMVVSVIQISKEWLTIGCRNGSLIIWHVRDGGTHVLGHDRNDLILGLHIINDKWLVSASETKICLWDLRVFLADIGDTAAQRPATTMTASASPTWDFHLRHREQRCRGMVGYKRQPGWILCSHWGRMTLWKLDEEDNRQPKMKHQLSIDCSIQDPILSHLAMSQSYFACANGTGMIRLYGWATPKHQLLNNLQQPRLQRVWKAHERRIKALQFSPDGNYLASSSLGFLHNRDSETTIRVWNLYGDAIWKWSPNDEPNINVYSLSFLPTRTEYYGGRYILATGGASGKVSVWDLKTVTHHIMNTTGSSVEEDASSLDGSSDEYVENVVTSRSVHSGKFCHDGDTAIYTLAALLDGPITILASGGRDGTVRLWCAD